MHLKSLKQRASSVPSTFSAAQYFPDVSSTHASFLSAIRKLLWYVNTMWLSIQFPPCPYFSSKSTMTVRAFSAVSALSSPSLEQKEDIILGTLNFTYSFSAWVFKLTWNAVAIGTWCLYDLVRERTKSLKGLVGSESSVSLTCGETAKQKYRKAGRGLLGNACKSCVGTGLGGNSTKTDWWLWVHES